MFKIVEKTALNPSMTKMVVEAPLIAKKAKPGQFIIFRVDEYGERVPLTIADYDAEKGTVTIIYYYLMLFEGMGAETKLKGNKYGFVFIICLTIVGYVAGFF